MKLRFILSEDVNIQKHQAQLDAVSKRTGIPQENLIDFLIEMDPSGKYTRWILKQIKFRNVIVPEDNLRVWEVLQHFDRNKQRLEVRDIMQYKRISDLEDALELVMGTGSKRSGALQYNPESLPGVEKIADDGPFALYHVTDADSLAELGEGTKWCTRRSYPRCQASDYIKSWGPIYVITNGNKVYIQVAVRGREIKDVKNNEIDVTELSIKVVKHVPYLAFAYLTNLVLSGETEDTKIQELESVIKKNPQWAVIYARDVIAGRWPEAEPYIMQDASCSYSYAIDSIKGRWPEAEPIIMKDPRLAVLYVKKLMDNNKWDDDGWPEAEPYIMKDPEWAYKYAEQILKRRWPEAEPYIMQSPVWSCWYAGEVIKGRWPEVEPLILQNHEHIISYISHAMNRERWPVAEPIMLQDPRLARKYAQHILKEPWPEAEPIIMKDPMEAASYAVDVLHRRWYEAEPIIMSDTGAAYYYQDWIENQTSDSSQS